MAPQPNRPLALPLFALVTAAMLAAVGCSRSVTTAPRMDASGPPSDRIARTVAASRYDGGSVDSEVVVTLAPGVLPEEVAAAYGAVLAGEAYERVAVFYPPAGVSPLDFSVLLRGDARVSTAEPNWLMESVEARQQSFAFDDGLGNPQAYAEQPAAQAIRIGLAHGIGRGHGVRVAVLDTGVDLTHPALAGRVVSDYDLVSGDYDASEQPDGVDNDGDGHTDEAFGHGTHVAGIVALTAPAAELLVIRGLDADGRGDLLCIAAGIRWAVNHGADVINLSIGALEQSDAVVQALAEARWAGVVVVASAGNWGAAHPEEFPARSHHANAIAATDASGRPAAFTSYADYVRLSAPGVGVRSAYPGGGWRLWSGTSMSAPFVSGAAAVLRGLHPEWGGAEIFKRLAGTASPLRDVPAEMLGKLGTGMLDLGAAAAEDVAGRADDMPPPDRLR